MKINRLFLLPIIGLVSGCMSSMDVSHSSIPKKKQTPQQLYLSSNDAFSMKKELGAKALFVDVRTRAEIEFVGIADATDVNIPYALSDFETWNEKKNRFKMVLNPNFSVAFKNRLEERGLDDSSPIILICRSGSRSAKAATLLNNLGYQNVHSVIDGFEGDKSKEGKRVVNGWKNNELPWSYNLEKYKMYFR